MSRSLVARARLTGHRSQQVFDVLLRTLAEPGTVRRLPPSFDDRGVPGPLWLPLALADVDTPVHIAGDDAGRWQTVVSGATDAPMVEIPAARIVVALSPDAVPLAELPVGTASAPEDGARFALPVRGLHADGNDGDQVVVLQGPGVPGVRRLGIDGLSVDVLRGLGRASGSFPAGFDTWLFTGAGRIAGLPRSTIIELEGG